MHSNVKDVSFQSEAFTENSHRSEEQLSDPEYSESITNRACAVCSKQHTELLFQQRFSSMSGGSLHSGYAVVVCKECGFCFADRIPCQEAFDDYYEKMSK